MVAIMIVSKRSCLFNFLLLSIMLACFDCDDDNDWMNKCANSCECKWQKGKRTSLCRFSGLKEVPYGLSKFIQNLDLTGNSIHELTDNIFSKRKLLNLQRIYLSDCGVEHLGRGAFSGLTILIELHLDGNRIRFLPDGIFKDNIRLRELHLSRNPLRKLGTFPILPNLRTLRLTHCQIETIERKSFMHLQALELLALDNNRIMRLTDDPFTHLHQLNTLTLYGNPWKCDCRMRSFLNWIMSQKLYSYPTSCNQPDRLSGKFWDELSVDEWACAPDIFVPRKIIHGRHGDNVTLSCRIVADPPAQKHWVLDGRILDDATPIPFSDQMYAVIYSRDWANLTITNVNEQDAGSYTCVGRNAGGAVEENVTLVIDGRTENVNFFLPIALDLGAIVGIATGIAGILIVLLLVSCCCLRFCQKNYAKTHVNGVSVGPLASKNSYQKVTQSDIDPPENEEADLVRSGDNPCPFLSMSRYYPDLVNALNGPSTSLSDKQSNLTVELPSRFSYISETPLDHRIRPRVSYRPSYVTLPRRPRLAPWNAAVAGRDPPYDNLGPRTGIDGSAVKGKTRGATTNSEHRNGNSDCPLSLISERYVSPLPSTLPSRKKRLSLPSSTRFENCLNNSAAAAVKINESPDTKGKFSDHDDFNVDAVLSDLQSLVGVDTFSIKKKIPPKIPPKPKNVLKSQVSFQDESEEGTEI